jgi:hypothetical protein
MIQTRRAAEGGQRALGQARGPVRLNIERLVLHGFAHADRHTVAAGVQTELARLMANGDRVRSLRKPLILERSNGGTIRVGAGASPRTTARQIARAIFRSLEASTADAGNSAPMRTGAARSEERR